MSTRKIDEEYLDAVLDTKVQGSRWWTDSNYKYEKMEHRKKRKFHFNFMYRINARKRHNTITRSTDTLLEAIAVHNKGYPTVVTLSDKNVNKNFVIDSVLFVRGPSEYNKNVSCKTCDLCARKNRNIVIGL